MFQLIPWSVLFGLEHEPLVTVDSCDGSVDSVPGLTSGSQYSICVRHYPLQSVMLVLQGSRQGHVAVPHSLI